MAAVVQDRSLTEAERVLRDLLARAPQDAGLHAELGAVLANSGRPEEAEASYREALRLKSDVGIVHYNLGNALRDLKRWNEAEQSYRRAAELQPDLPEAHYNLAIARRVLGRLEEAERSYATAAALRPNFAEAHNNRGIVLADLGRLEEAEQSYRLAIAAKPGHVIAYSNLGNAQRQLGRIEDAERSYRKALELNPNLAAAHNHLGNTMRDLGYLEDAEQSYRKALALDPAAVGTHSNLAFLLNYIPGRSAAEIFAEHLEYGRRFDGHSSHWPHADLQEPGRRLRVGYVSGDLRDHAVAYFIEPVLERHQHGNCEAICYYNNLRADRVTQRLKGVAHEWRDVALLDDAALEEMIRRDRIDVLVDLAGHTAQNRLPVFARRPAPVQASWLGYLNTTGMAAMDYRITDSVATPAGPLDACNSEQLIRLPHSQWCYLPPADCPDSARLPAAGASQFTFAVFTTPPKVSDSMIGLWREVLDRVPGSRLLVVYAIVGIAPAWQQDRFRRLGIGPDRLTLLGSQTFGNYLELHRSVDLLLDTSPYTGGTTTCHALWMGVPLVTLAGETATSRGGASLLHAIGLAELVAQSPQQYVEIAAGLAEDRTRLHALRSGLRDRLARSPLMDAVGFTANLESAYREMWRLSCEKRRG